MESQEQDRRAKRVRRVPHATRVEICARNAAAAVFEAETLNLSGRGMCVRSEYLPDVQTPLVLRFQSGQEEAVVEGTVAWRGEEDSSLLGIKFTAVDSQSVRILRGICALPTPASTAEEPGSAPEETSLRGMGRGAPVRLHMSGLAAPMKACVFEESDTTLYVGSQLEFLRLGHELQLEGVDRGVRGPVAIESVDVTIDPETQVPHLVLALRYGAAEDATPSPSVIGDADDERVFDPRHRPSLEAADSDGDDPDLELLAAEELFKGRVEAWASQAGRSMRTASGKMAHLGGRVAQGVGGLIKATSQQLGTDKHDRKASASGARRTTSPARRASQVPPVAARRGTRGNGRFSRGGEGRSSSVAPDDVQLVARKRRLLGAGAALLMVGVVGAFQWGSASNPADPAASAATAGQPLAAAPVGAAPSAGFPEIAPLNTQEQLAEAGNGVVAQVPLFGPQQMATTEAAPNSPARHPVVDEIGMSQDQVFSNPKGVPMAKVVEKTEEPRPAARAKSSDLEFQIGRMVLPVVHRLRLDGAGAALQGKALPNGFQILVPGRKVMEKGNAIESRDPRITQVRVSNGPAGGTVTFRFKSDVPGYKARLRKDYVEFFINSAAR